jgi:hypothetical protein
MSRPWHDWYHCNGNTYATWLRGDARGWRSRHHREHVEGDYKSPPPPGRDEKIRDQSRRLQKKPPVLLAPTQAALAGAVMVRRLRQDSIELLSLAIDDRHFHLVGRFPDHHPRLAIGRAKQRAAALLIQRFPELSAPIWARRCRCLPIEDRKHQIAAVKYDLDHILESALFVWSFKDPLPELPDF